MNGIEHLTPAGVFSVPTYSQVVVSSRPRTVHISGQVATAADGSIVGAGDLGAQATQVMENLRRCLTAAGATFADVVKITTYVVGYRPEHRAVISAARSPFFAGGAPPASTLVGVEALAVPEWLIEIEATAVLD